MKSLNVDRNLTGCGWLAERSILCNQRDHVPSIPPRFSSCSIHFRQGSTAPLLTSPFTITDRFFLLIDRRWDGQSELKPSPASIMKLSYTHLLAIFVPNIEVGFQSTWQKSSKQNCATHPACSSKTWWTPVRRRPRLWLLGLIYRPYRH